MSSVRPSLQLGTTTKKISITVTSPHGLGPPGAEKGTQCSRLAQNLDLVHISIGDLLRAEQHQPLSVRAEAIRAHYEDGKDLNDRIYVDVLGEQLSAQIQAGKTNFILDGFPRNISQLQLFKGRIVKETLPLLSLSLSLSFSHFLSHYQSRAPNQIRNARKSPQHLSKPLTEIYVAMQDVNNKILTMLCFHCPEEVTRARVLHRGLTSGRANDTETAFHERYERFTKRAEAVLNSYRSAGMLIEVSQKRISPTSALSSLC